MILTAILAATVLSIEARAGSDVSNGTSDPRKTYRGVLMQQGRPQMDSDSGSNNSDGAKLGGNKKFNGGVVRMQQGRPQIDSDGGSKPSGSTKQRGVR